MQSGDVRTPPGISRDGDGVARCWWCISSPEYVHYHDTEWGVPVTGDVRLFEKICLEGFQAGLSWILILRRRAYLREVFANFDLDRVARFDDRQVTRLVKDPGVIRHRGKIQSAIHNARRAQALRDEFGSLANYFWSFEPTAQERPRRVSRRWLSAHPTSPASRALSRDLRRRGWTFVGPTTLYAFMQAMGLVNDHLPDCHVHAAIESARRALRRPGTRHSI